jgi:hypothetical protein
LVQGLQALYLGTFHQALDLSRLEISLQRHREHTKERGQSINVTQNLIKINLQIQTMAHDLYLTSLQTDILGTYGENLKDAAGINTYIETNNARRQYCDALKPPRNLKEFDKWIDNWEKAMDIANSKDIEVTKAAAEWFSDLIGTLEKILPTWSEAYELTRTHEVENNTLVYRTVTNDLRRVVEKERHKGWKLAKGSFGPTFAGETYQYAAVESPPDAEESTGVGAKRRARDDGRGIEAKRRKRGRASRDQRKDVSEARRVCRGCEGFHSTKMTKPLKAGFLEFKRGR